MRKYTSWSGWLLIALAGASTAGASIWEDLYFGLGVLATPSGTPVTAATGGGQQNGERFGRLRIVPNQPGNGYDLEFDRTFGLDSRGRPEVLDLGSFELQLSGATQATLGITTTPIPTLSAQVLAGNLNYSVRGKSGAQDATLSGTLNASQNFEVNQLGFYTLSLQVENANSQLTLDGIAVDDARDSDFNVGPITVEGNIFFDLATALLTSVGVDTTGLESIFPKSPIDRIDDEIRSALERQANVLGITLTNDADSLTMTAADATAAQQVDTLPTSLAVDTLPLPSVVPEPASVGLLLLGLAGAWVRRRT